MYSSIRKLWRGMLVFAVLVSIQACSASGTAMRSVSAEDSDKAAISRYLEKVPVGKRTVLDLTDPITEAGVYAEYRLAGVTPKSDPELFEQLAEYKKRQLDMRAKGLPISVSSMLASAGVPATEPQPYIQMRGFSGYVNNLGFDVTATAYVPYGQPANGTPDRRLKITQQLLNAQRIAISQSKTTDSSLNPNADLRNMPASSYKTPQKPSGLVLAKADLIYWYAGKIALTSTQVWGANVGDTGGPAVISKALTDPRHITTKPILNEPVIVCLNRASQYGDGLCDYGPTQPLHTAVSVIFPVSGQVKYNQRIIPNDLAPPDSSPYIEIMLGDGNGGVCQVSPDDSSTPKDDVTISNDQLSLSWNFPTANFGPVCYSNGTVLPFSVTVTSMLNDGGQFGQPLTVVWASDITAGSSVDPENYQQVSPVEIQWGCVLEGTMVKLANASVSEAPIESLRPGNIIATKDGGRLRVRSTLKGTDKEFVRIGAGKDTVMLTPDHPVRTHRGMVAASQVKVGDQVYDKRGQAVRVNEASKHNFEAARTVYNLVLETEDRTDIANPEDAVFVAGGIQIGDNAMQGQIVKQRIKSGR